MERRSTAAATFTTGGYVVAEEGRARGAGWARPVWRLGSACYLAHVAAAFAVHYGWSHAAAAAGTAAQTAALTGVGLWVNYAFTLVWVGEGLWTRRWGADADRRLTTVVRGLFLCMIVNGAVIFVDGPRRWLGVAVVVALLAIWRRRRGGPGPGRALT